MSYQAEVTIPNDTRPGTPLRPRDTRTSEEAQAALVSTARKNPCFTCGNPEAKLRKNLPLRFVWPSACTLCGQCWAQFGGQADAAEIGPAPRAALEVRSVGPAEWQPILDAQPWRGELRRDARGRVESLVSELCRWAGWESGETWPTWDRLMAATGWGRSQLAAWLRQLWILGWIDRVEPGSTPATRPMGSRIEGNRAAVYGLLVPAYADEAARPALQREYTTTLAQLKAAIAQVKQAGEKNWTPTGSLDPVELRLEVGYLRTRAREIFHRLGGGSGGGKNPIEPLRGSFDESERRLWARTVPTTRAEMLAAAAELRRQHPVLARLSARAVRSECRTWWRAGWCNDGILHALRSRPVGWSGTSTARSHAVYAVIHPAGWLRSRLSIWTTRTTKRQVKPLPDPTLQRDIRRWNVDQAVGEAERQAEADRAAYGRIGARLLAEVRAAAGGRYWQPTPGQAAAALADRIRLDRPAGQPTARDRAVAAVAEHMQAKQQRPRLSPLQQELRDRALAAAAARRTGGGATGYRPRRDRHGRR